MLPGIAHGILRLFPSQPALAFEAIPAAGHVVFEFVELSPRMFARGVVAVAIRRGVIVVVVEVGAEISAAGILIAPIVVVVIGCEADIVPAGLCGFSACA